MTARRLARRVILTVKLTIRATRPAGGPHTPIGCGRIVGMTLPGFPDPANRRPRPRPGYRRGSDLGGTLRPLGAGGDVPPGHDPTGRDCTRADSAQPRLGPVGSHRAGAASGTRPAGDRPRSSRTRAAAAGARRMSRRAVDRLDQASCSGGAGESGLSKVLWLNVVQTGGDGMIGVALANTIFFAAATNQQRGNVALYLLITMAPFAIVAPVIGPLLDRMQHGRRSALAGTMGVRALLAWIMAANYHSIGLYPAVFGFLVVSKAFNVLKAAVVPRVSPPRMTLVTANARLTIFGLAGGTVFGAIGAGVVRLGGSSWTLRLAVLVFAVAGVLALRLPERVDSAAGEARATVMRAEPADSAPPGRRRRTLGPVVVTALRGSASLRALSGFLTLFLAFLIQHDYRGHGSAAAIALGALAVAAGGGSFLGTAAGARLRLGRPEITVLACVGAATTMCVLAALTYSIELAVAAALVAGVTNSLAKLSLDAIIQREVPETLRVSAFGRSETVLQLAWVLGGGLGIALPMDGRIGFAVAAVLLAAGTAAILVSRWRTANRRRTIDERRYGARAADWSTSPGGRAAAPE